MAARIAYHEYLQHSAYICQVGRAFRTGLTHMGFYANAAIQTRIPRIRHVEDHVSFTDDEIASRKGGQQPDQLIAQVIESTLTAGTRDAGQQYQIFLLSGPEHPDTVQLSKTNHQRHLVRGGKAWAWTLGQR